jgi:hypothetical protein
MTTSISARFKWYQQLHGQPADADADTILTMRRLENDRRMKEAWAIIDRRDPKAFSHILFVLLEAKWKADRIADFPLYKSRLKSRHDDLIAAADALTLYVKMNLDHSNAVDGVTAPSWQKDHENMVECHRMLVWVKDRIEGVSKATLEALARDTPTSQKRDAPNVAFAVMLCRSLKARLGTPLYTFAATAATVVYQLNDEMAVDAVRQAYKRDEAKRTKPVDRTI